MFPVWRTTFKKELSKHGVIFCSFSEAVINHPELVKKYLGSVIPRTDNYFAALNSAVFTDGSFCYIPKNVKCPLVKYPILFGIARILEGKSTPLDGLEGLMNMPMQMENFDEGRTQYTGIRRRRRINSPDEE